MLATLADSGTRFVMVIFLFNVSELLRWRACGVGALLESLLLLLTWIRIGLTSVATLEYPGADNTNNETRITTPIRVPHRWRACGPSPRVSTIINNTKLIITTITICSPRWRACGPRRRVSMIINTNNHNNNKSLTSMARPRVSMIINNNTTIQITIITWSPRWRACGPRPRVSMIIDNNNQTLIITMPFWWRKMFFLEDLSWFFSLPRCLFWSSGHALAPLAPVPFFRPALSLCGESCMLWRIQNNICCDASCMIWEIHNICKYIYIRVSPRWRACGPRRRSSASRPSPPAWCAPRSSAPGARRVQNRVMYHDAWFRGRAAEAIYVHAYMYVSIYIIYTSYIYIDIYIDI